MTWILIIYFGSVGVFLLLYCFGSLIKKEMRDVEMWRIFKEAFTPGFNIILSFMLLAFIVLVFYEWIDRWYQIWWLDKERKKIFRNKL